MPHDHLIRVGNAEGRSMHEYISWKSMDGVAGKIEEECGRRFGWGGRERGAAPPRGAPSGGEPRQLKPVGRRSATAWDPSGGRRRDRDRTSQPGRETKVKRGNISRGTARLGVFALSQCFT